MLRAQTARRVARAVASTLQRSQQNSARASASQHFSASIVEPNFRFFSSYSSFSEPGSLFLDVTPLTSTSESTSESVSQDRDAQLRADVRAMGSLLGRIIQDHHGVEVFDKIEELRALAKKWREHGAGRKEPSAKEAASTFDELATACSKLSNEELLIIARAFTHFLAIANAAEGHHRCRLMNTYTSGSADALPDKKDSCGGVLKSLIAQGHSAGEIYDCLTSQRVELVLTAHPTEVNRRTILGELDFVFRSTTRRCLLLTTIYFLPSFLPFFSCFRKATTSAADSH